MKHIPALDGLRAIAVLSVVAYHAGLPVPAGFVGVDVFFVISGYLITRLLHDEVQATSRIDFMAFYARRARRILPALAVVVLLTLLVADWLGVAGVAQSAAAAGAFVANVFFQTQTAGYWAGDAKSMPLLHLWSLSVEEQFYLVWPVVLILARRKPVAALAVLAAVSLALAEWWLWRSPSAAFYQMPARAWELALGGLVALRPVNVPKGSAWIGLAVVLLACFVPLGHFPGVGALPAVAGSALLIAAIQNGESPRLLTLRPVAFVGLVSYSLYLWHWPLLALDRAMHVGEAPLSVRLSLVAAAFVLAVVSYRYVETPFRRSRASHRRSVAAGVCCVLALSGCAWAMIPTPAPAPPLPPCDASKIQRPSCVAGGQKLVLWGDSFAHSWSPLALAIAKQQREPAVAFATDACPAFIGTLRLDTDEGTQNCRRRNEALVAYLKANGADTVFIASRWQQYIEPNAEAGFLATIPAIAPYVRRILIIGPTPVVLDDGPKCARLGVSCAVTRKAYLANSAKQWAMVRQMARNPKVTVIDAAQWLCDGDECPGVRDGLPLYRDNAHVTHETARRFASDYVR